MMKKLFPALLAGILILNLQAFAAGSQPVSVIGRGIPAQGPGPGAPTAQTAAAVPDGISLPEEAEVLITVESGKGEVSGTLKLYTKNAQSGDGTVWTEILSTTAMLGKNGLGKEKEGDNKTPLGVFKMNTPFGIKDALPGFPANYLKVGKNHYWCGDSDSELYNRMADASGSVSFSKSESEHLTDYAGYYDYCIDTGYNPEGTPHKGSALFLHCVVRGQTTHGCIAIPEADMIETLKHYREGRTYIAIYDRENLSSILK